MLASTALKADDGNPLQLWGKGKISDRENRRTQNSNRGNYPVILNVVILVQTFTIHLLIQNEVRGDAHVTLTLRS